MTHDCHICGRDTVVEIAAYRQLRRVTSDCCPWPKGGALGVCRSCGATQKLIGAAWRGEIERIYASYAIYHQGGGAEQAVFDQASGAAQTRSSRLVDRLVHVTAIPEEGRLLDIGCGNGAFLGEFAKRRSRWRLTGTEVNDHNRAAVEAIPGIECFHVGGHEILDGRFGLISLIHVLEHIENPVPFVAGLRARLEPGGYLFIEVPYFVDNPFDLLIADHGTHFTPAVLRAVLCAGGFTIVSIATDWVTKEISVIARPGSDHPDSALEPTGNMDGQAETGVRWLESFANRARDAASLGPCGIFGTSIAAVWLYGELDGRVAFFADEDRNRVGFSLFDKPVLAPADRPATATLLLALAPAVAAQVAVRLASDGCRGAIVTPASCSTAR